MSSLAEEVSSLANSRNSIVSLDTQSHKNIAEPVENQSNLRNQNIHATNARDQTQGRVEMSSQTPTPNNASEPTRLQNTGASNQSTQMAHNDSPCPVNEQSIGRTVSASNTNHPIDNKKQEKNNNLLPFSIPEILS